MLVLLCHGSVLVSCCCPLRSNVTSWWVAFIPAHSERSVVPSVLLWWDLQGPLSPSSPFLWIHDGKSAYLSSRDDFSPNTPCGRLCSIVPM